MVYHAATGGGFYRFSLRIYSDITEDLSQEEVIERIKLVVLPFEIEFKTVDLFSRYNLNHFVAEEFSQDRVFLVGDAAHHISPMCGFSLNTGLADSWNLVWKLYLTSCKITKPTILETYHEERYTVAERMIELSVKLQAIYNLDSVMIGVESQQELNYAWTRNKGFMTGIGVEYHISSLNLYASDDIDLRVRPGMRSPDGRITPSMITDGVTPTRLLDLFTAVPIFHILVFMGDPSHNNDYLEKLADLVTLQRLSPFTPNRRKFVEYKEIYELIIIVPANVSQPSCTSIVEAAGGIYYTDDVTEDEGLYARYGVDLQEGAIVVVRPDGIVGNHLQFYTK
ncbi:FAD binding domain-containing protein [Jimgerdemannia flammicorona]|uniref:FAD binding domain-containing protein n=1 Tax=Jimgerdemannia flammicorona TaxID=994334 RepID=A0A433D548_9FUNG|nr:FAD binding domain-containing protein [Jimgerdemannia flammicorona]